jgi:hypothetical protein
VGAIVPNPYGKLKGRSGQQGRLVSYSVDVQGGCLGARQVDVDLSLEGDARKVSRQQANVALGADGTFCLRNTGRRALHLNNVLVGRKGLSVCLSVRLSVFVQPSGCIFGSRLHKTG